MALDFYHLDPDAVMKATERAGFQPTGEFLQLNSYENRVFRIKLEDRSTVVAKFYRPGRWSREQILEEHSFLKELNEEDVSVNLPLELNIQLPQNHLPTKSQPQSSLMDFENIFVAYFPLFQGRQVTELLDPDWTRVGRLMAQVHNIGERKKSKYRLSFDVNHPNGWPALDELSKWIDPTVSNRYLNAAEELLSLYQENVNPKQFFRIHGDLHKGNLLQRDQAFFLVDFDDHVMGPAIQDLWMLFSDHESFDQEVDLFLTGYEELREFPEEQLKWVPLMRAFRLIGYSAWIARRWTDPSFPRLFPHFNTYSYWAEETEALEKCLNDFYSQPTL